MKVSFYSFLSTKVRSYMKKIVGLHSFQQHLSLILHIPKLLKNILKIKLSYCKLMRFKYVMTVI
jgi:hypothetical protein